MPTDQVVPLSAETLYQGWRASVILGKEVRSKDGGKLGTVRNVLINPLGKIESLLVETENAGERKEFVFRLPWSRIDAASLPGSVTTDVARADTAELGLFFGESGAAAGPNAFALTQVTGEYARLQAGQGFGYVADVVFSREGSMIAVLVTRAWGREGGGTYAFGFPGSIGPWRPDMSYYGLPYVTAEQALAAGVPVDLIRFRAGAG